METSWNQTYICGDLFFWSMDRFPERHHSKGRHRDAAPGTKALSSPSGRVHQSWGALLPACWISNVKAYPPGTHGTAGEQTAETLLALTELGKWCTSSLVGAVMTLGGRAICMRKAKAMLFVFLCNEVTWDNLWFLVSCLGYRVTFLTGLLGYVCLGQKGADPRKTSRRRLCCRAVVLLGQPMHPPAYVWSENADSEHSLEIDKYQSYEGSQPIWWARAWPCAVMMSQRGEVVVEADHRAAAQSVAVSCAHVLWGDPAEVRMLWASCLSPPCLIPGGIIPCGNPPDQT